MPRWFLPVVLCGLTLLVGACNPAYLPVPATGVLEADEAEIGFYGSFGYLGRKIRPTTYRGVVANFGLYFRKGIMENMDWTMTLDTFGVSTAIGIVQDPDNETVIRPRVGVGWMTAIVGVDWATRLSEGPRTDYAIGCSMLSWVGDAFWTDDPGLSYGIRIGALGQVAAEPRWGAPVSGGIRMDWVPFQFGGRGSTETLTDIIGSRNPFGEQPGPTVLTGWPPPRFAFEPTAWTVTGGPAITYHRDRTNWTHGGEPEED